MGRLPDGVMNIFQIGGHLRPSGTRRLDTSFTCGSTSMLQPQITAVGLPHHSVLTACYLLRLVVWLLWNMGSCEEHISACLPLLAWATPEPCSPTAEGAFSELQPGFLILFLWVQKAQGKELDITGATSCWKTEGMPSDIVITPPLKFSLIKINGFYHYRQIPFERVENVRLSPPLPLFWSCIMREEKNFHLWSKHNLLVGPVLVRLSQSLENLMMDLPQPLYKVNLIATLPSAFTMLC